jgi:predicted amidohydrolase
LNKHSEEGERKGADLMTTKFDILLKGGVVVDPVSQIEGVMDVGIRQGKIAQIGQT